MTNLETFRASARTVSVATFAAAFGQDAAECLPSNATAVRVYPGDHWIVQVGPRMASEHYKHWLLILERDEHDTRDGHLTLADLEEILHRWTLDECGQPEAAPTLAGIDAITLKAMTRVDGSQYEVARIWIGGIPFSADLNPHVETITRRFAAENGLTVDDLRRPAPVAN